MSLCPDKKGVTARSHLLHIRVQSAKPRGCSEADGTGRIALTPELQKGSLHNVFGSRPVTAGSEAF